VTSVRNDIHLFTVAANCYEKLCLVELIKLAVSGLPKLFSCSV